jgi:hypothetical protein
MAECYHARKARQVMDRAYSRHVTISKVIRQFLTFSNPILRANLTLNYLFLVYFLPPKTRR